ncbi:PaaI family thioesterase [Rhodococcus sp. D2-41]|uniref:PaaI family thioesterase n=1 Tax=Speluncibacter jeojiensis TaxID=2710754 RepID=A0A9X4LZG8_9ACTN|nr:PaaI family thioesterase [Rhodococcus sp. D2-41]MDG3011896.1 PaaI family thioesterase [Rhodococcus sp. D2-41]MDG3013347.1 PaaI family thioesterase [Corynebacteriales bacterium D3-21]
MPHAIGPAVPALDRVNTMMGVEAHLTASGRRVLRQRIGRRFHDHRGRTVLGSVGVLVDTGLGGAAYAGMSVKPRSVVSQMSIAMGAPMPAEGLLTVSAHSVHLDDESGLGRGEVLDGDGAAVLSTLSRVLTVSRSGTAAAGDDDGPVAFPEPEPCCTPDELAGRSGAEVVTGISAGRLPRGPLAGLLGFEVSAAERGRVVAQVQPQSWMSNMLGSVQGGILTSIANLVSEFAAQSLTEAGQDYRLLDLRLEFLRSPSVDGPSIRAESEVVRAGRRLAVVESQLLGGDGQVLARAGATAQLR